MLHGRQTKRDFVGIIDRIKQRLYDWKASTLSMAGRTTLARSVISSILYYSMKSTRIPRAIYLEIEKLQRNFIWGHVDGLRKAHTISWDTICKDKRIGGWA